MRTQISPSWKGHWRWLVCAILPLLVVCVLAQAQPGPPSIAAGGVVNAAKYTPDLAPGAMASIFGTNLAAATQAGTEQILPTSIAGVSVEITDSTGRTMLAPLYFISPGQVNCQLPFTLATGAAQVRVRTPQGVSPPATAVIQPAAPGLFTVDGTGTGDPFVLHADFSIVRGIHPATPGEYVVLLVTGLGGVHPPAEAGRPGGDTGQWGPLNWTVTKPAVFIGDREAPLAFWGLMPRFAGVYQLNVQVPADLSPGVYPIEVRAEGASSQPGLAVYIGRAAPAVATSTVSSAGGVVSGAGVTVSIPAGAFQEPATVSILQPENFQPASITAISDRFTLRGLPAELAQPVTITIPLRERPPAGVETLVALDSGPGVRGTGVEFLEATVEGNTARITLPASSESSGLEVTGTPGVARLAAASPPEYAAQASGPEISFYVATFYRRETSSNGHFLIFYPSGDSLLESKIPQIGQVLEEAYRKIEGLGLSWALRKRWPMRVVIYPMEGENRDKWGEAISSALGKDYGSITLNSNKLSGAGLSDDFKATIGHELFHLMQDLYDPRSAYRISKFPSHWLWFWEAASTWFESVMLDDDNYIPGTVTGDNYTFLTRHGLEYEPGDQKSVQSHGYGASMFLKYLTKTYPRTSVGDVVKLAAARAPGLLASSRYSPAEAMDSPSIYFSLGNRWLDFVENYAEGKIYGREFPTMGMILAQRAEAYTFSQDSDTGTTFTWNSPNLSARVFQIRFMQPWPDNTGLTLSLEEAGETVKAFLYKVKSQGWTKLGSFTSSITLDNAEQFQKDNAQLLIVVADGSGSGKFRSQVPTRLRIRKGGDLLKVLQGTTKINHKIYGDISSPCNGTMAGTFYSKGPLSWSGASFSVQTQDSDLLRAGEQPYDLVISGKLSPDGLTLVELNYQRSRTIDRKYKDAAGTEFYEYEQSMEQWSVRNVPMTSDPDRVLQGKSTPRYEARGAAGAAAVRGYSKVVRYWTGPANQFTPDKIREYSCSLTISGSQDGTDTYFSK